LLFYYNTGSIAKKWNAYFIRVLGGQMAKNWLQVLNPRGKYNSAYIV